MHPYILFFLCDLCCLVDALSESVGNSFSDFVLDELKLVLSRMDIFSGCFVCMCCFFFIDCIERVNNETAIWFVILKAKPPVF